MRTLASTGFAGAALLLAARLSFADQVVLSATADNTLYENATGSRSNGLGEHFFAGKTNDGLIRRGVLRFDISAIPAGSTVTSVQLALDMSRTQAGAQPVALHRVQTAWGEGTSDAGAEEGNGAASTTGDATWIHSLFPGSNWAAAGGDFAATESATTQVAGVGVYNWGSTPGMVADVQAWLDGPAVNHGWLVRGAEAASQTAKRFGSRNNLTPANQPRLTVIYTLPAQPGACCESDGRCTQVLQAACTGSFQGSGSVCGVGGMCGACCDAPACSFKIAATCTQYQGDGTSCTPDPCVIAPRGACCTATGCVPNTTVAGCAALTGTYQGDNSTCTPDPCVIAPRGACCTGTTCIDARTEAECQSLGGIFQGRDQTCATSPCADDSRACCLPGDVCTVMNRDDCRAMGGDDQGGGSVCNPNICGRGACCIGGGCVEGGRGRDCVEMGGIYHGPNSVCAPDPCVAVCNAAAISPIQRLLAVKVNLARDVRMEWTSDPNATGYNTWWVDQKSEIPQANEPSGIAASVTGCRGTPATTCTHLGAVPPTIGQQLFYNVLGSCNGIEAAK